MSRWTTPVNGVSTPGATGVLSNTATLATTPPDLTMADHTSTDDTTLQVEADLAITKTDGQTTAIPGSAITYTITVVNNGPSNAGGNTVTDTFPVQMLNPTWTCTPTVGATCTAGPVAGDINDMVDIAAGGSVVYTATGTIDPMFTGQVSNTADVTPGVPTRTRGTTRQPMLPMWFCHRRSPPPKMSAETSRPLERSPTP